MILSDLVAVMRDGLVVQYGPAQDVYRRPEHLYVATFIGRPRMGLVRGRLRVDAGAAELAAEGLRLRWTLDEPPPPGLAGAEREVLLGMRAEDVRLGPPAGDEAGFEGEVDLLEPLGSDTFVEVRRGPHRLTARVEPDRAPRMGESVRLQAPWSRLHIFDAASELRIN